MTRAIVLCSLLSFLSAPANGDLLPLPPLPSDGSLQLTFEILPSTPDEPLPDSLRAYEGGRLALEEAWARGDRYRKTTVVFPLPSGDTQERVLFFAEEGQRIRMIGFHRILRHIGLPDGETIVFNPGPDVPMQGRGLTVPGDTYTFLGLFTALGGIAGQPRPVRAHLWIEGTGTVPVQIRPDGEESLTILATKVESLRLHVEPRDGATAPRATVWVTARPPHTFLQYEGPADFLDAEAPRVLVRATSSSEQVRRAFEGVVPEPRPD